MYNNINNKVEPILEKLFSMQRFGIMPGLERTYKLLDFLGNPHTEFPSIHIAGTNGKGSVASMIASILTESGFKTGLYTSPHIYKFNERIRINGIEISDEDLIRYANLLIPESYKYEVTFFEITTAMAFKYFKDNNVDIAVIETGMGGRFDSTNVLNPLLSIITKIDIDHTEYLGNTIEEIAFEKAGIIKPNNKTIISPNTEEVYNVISRKAKEVNSELFFSDEYVKISNIKYNSDLTMILHVSCSNNDYLDLISLLPGKHQIDNIKTVITAIDLLQNHFGININNEFKYNLNKINTFNGLINIKKNTGLWGRIDLLRQNPLLILDTSHNPSGIGRLIETINLYGLANQKFNIVFSVMADKDVETVLKLLKPVCKTLFACNLSVDRAMKSQEIKLIADNLNYDNIKCYDNVKSCLEYVLSLDNPTIIVGSFYLAGEIMEQGLLNNIII